jgi:mannose PTS system EIIA component
MSVGILLITQSGIGSAIHAAAQANAGNGGSKIQSYDIQPGLDRQAQLVAAGAVFRKVDSGEGVLMLVDTQGGASDQLAIALSQLGTTCQRVSGLSLPMLVRVIHYSEQGLDELTRTAAAGGRTGVVINHA